MLRGSADFFGLNHYSSKFVAPSAGGGGAGISMWGAVQSGGYFDDQKVSESGHPQWAKTDMGCTAARLELTRSLKFSRACLSPRGRSTLVSAGDVVAWGLHRLLLYIQRRYAPRGGVLITENGCAVCEPTADAATAAALPRLLETFPHEGHILQVPHD